MNAVTGAADTLGSLPRRTGKPPATNTPAIPHTQLDQLPDSPAIDRLLTSRLFALPSVEQRPTVISVPGARGLWLADAAGAAPAHVFMAEREFAHVHPNLSLHVVLPEEQAQQVVFAGWGQWHPWVLDGRVEAAVVLVFAPRHVGEVEIVTRIVRCSWRQAIEAATPKTSKADS